jgi:argininosuccinate lyase
MTTLWGGRFQKPPAELMQQLNDSIGFDQRLYGADIQGSIAYARALARAGLITADELDQLASGLDQVQREFETRAFQIMPTDEDIHTAVERRLGELIGPTAGKLHTGRSRNDQVVTDLRLYLLEAISQLDQMLLALQEAIVEKAAAHLDALMPGYTHLQPAQPVRFSHWLMSYFWKLQRDHERLNDLRRRTAVSPLGAGALAGNPFGIDRQALAEELGFSSISENSMDAVSDRDFVVEFLSSAALLQIHLSGLAEDLILWTGHASAFVEIDEAYTTGSSLMPQKKNPDSLELLRGKSGRVAGHLVGLLMTLKGLPSAYNKDLQEDKQGLFDVIDTLTLELPVAAEMVRTLSVNRGRMLAALDSALLATDIADYLVRKGVPFRESHHVVGQAVKQAQERDLPLNDLLLETFQAIHPAFDEEVYEVFSFERSVEARDVVGGTAMAAVRAQIDKARALLAGGAVEIES